MKPPSQHSHAASTGQLQTTRVRQRSGRMAQCICTVGTNCSPNSAEKEQNTNQLVVECLLAGEDPPLRKKKYRDLDRRLRTVVLDYENRSSIDYLRRYSHNINLMD
ncbi:hypothetical protein CHS0354_017949 [Potamilus streckersoni]|uniref:Uncharacterized protein n=1 Tax=Potamilus streckersoni TaxID=2493646 RepID=A0AAE0RVZ7_9BIVA|nr:hypothetical protein CHS0354_017949 [Potamilus streckersoni]